MDINAILQAILSNPFIAWGGSIIIGIALLPVMSTVLDMIISALSDVMTVINRNIVDMIPIIPLRTWMQDEQVKMLNKSIETIKVAIKKIQEN